MYRQYVHYLVTLSRQHFSDFKHTPYCDRQRSVSYSVNNIKITIITVVVYKGRSRPATDGIVDLVNIIATDVWDPCDNSTFSVHSNVSVVVIGEPDCVYSIFVHCFPH